MATSIKLLTLNCWGLKYVSKNRKERLHAIADKIAESDAYDVIALQEVWVREDWDYIETQCRSLYPYRRLYSSGMLTGPGLAVLSKIPIESTFLYKFPMNGRPSAFFRGDWYVGKGVSVTLLRPIAENSTPIALLNSHMHAPYADDGDAAYLCHRTCQAWDLTRVAQIMAKAGYGVILVGDLNSVPGSLPYKLFTVETGLCDSWEQIHGATDLAKLALMKPEDQIKVGATTCDSVLNTWTAHKPPTKACRLDYVLVDNKKIKPIDAGVRFTELIPGIGSYSDHFAFYTEIEIADKDKQFGDPIDTAVNTVDNSVKLEVYHGVRDCLLQYQATIEWQRTWRSWHFYSSVVVVIGLLVGVAFVSSPLPWMSVIFSLIAVLVGISGIIDGLIAWLFGNYEERGLEEVRLEVLDRERSLDGFKI